jgi:predicted metal-dependent phosphoesterase TrpH
MTINPFGQPGRFFKGNLHTHSTQSDGQLPPHEVCRRYREAGYDFICLSDHFLPAYDFQVSDTRPYRTDSFTTILGAEVHVPSTSLGEKWHLLANGLPLDFAPPREGEGGAELARRCAEAGAFVSIVHPEWYALGVDDAQTIDAAHAIEVYNHTSAVRTSRGGGSALLDQLLAQGRRIHALATDDAHFLVDDAFGGWVMVKAESNEPELLVQALKAGHYYSTQGPVIEDIRVEGDEVVVDCSPAFGVYLLGKGSRADQSEHRGQTSARLNAARMGKGGFMRVVVVDEQGLSAWSNSLWRPID